MTTDPFTAAARAEARREAPHYDRETLAYGQHMAEWARTHLAAQEPTDAEVLAAMTAYEGHPDRVSAWRAALTAVRSIRRDVENRNG